MNLELVHEFDFSTTRFVTTMFVIITLLLTYTLGILVFRKLVTRKMRILTERFSRQLVGELVDYMDSPQSFPLVPNQNTIEKAALRTAMLKNMVAVVGVEKEFLISRYEQHDFVQSDIDGLDSPLWHIRLSSLVNMGSLASSGLAPFFYAMLEDSSPMVAAAAALAIVRTDHPLNTPEILFRFPHSVFERYDISVEIVTQYLGRYGVHKAADIFDSDISRNLKYALVHVLCRERSNGSAIQLVRVLNTTSELPEIFLAEIIWAIGATGDPEMKSSISRFLTHKSHFVRATVLKALLESNDVVAHAYVQMYEKDEHIEVKRVIAKYRNLEAKGKGGESA
ncbi:MAG TPA: HEAT repeat domain-containing protein [Pseudobdellovibrionaceae bacterium]|nr:HEAT repeat domain-containing protein [Pseudobdellovibrionaceae bacterium]